MGADILYNVPSRKIYIHSRQALHFFSQPQPQRPVMMDGWKLPVYPSASPSVHAKIRSHHRRRHQSHLFLSILFRGNRTSLPNLTAATIGPPPNLPSANLPLCHSATRYVDAITCSSQASQGGSATSSTEASWNPNRMDGRLSRVYNPAGRGWVIWPSTIPATIHRPRLGLQR